jgi:hypothetical protein
LESEKQDELTFDNEPTANSSNPVKSGGIYTELNDIKGDLTGLKEDINDLGLSVVDGKLNITYEEVTA